MMSSNIEEKLKEYRRRKQNEKKTDVSSRNNIWKIFFPEWVTHFFKSTILNSNIPTGTTESSQQDLPKTTVEDPSSFVNLKSTNTAHARKRYQSKEDVLLDEVILVYLQGELFTI